MYIFQVGIMETFFTLVLLMVSISAGQAELCRKFERPENPTCDRKFCPRERIIDGVNNKCVSDDDQYKCGIFLKVR